MPASPARVSDIYLLDPVLDFLRLLWSIEHALQRISKRMASRIGVTGPQRLVLRIVQRYPGISAGELAHIVRLHPSTITGILQRLVARGLLDRTRDPHDSRRAHLRLTRRAVPFTRQSEGTVEQAVTRVLQRGGPPTVRAARTLLAALVRDLDRQ
jgi:DNA-binding MarR family transcriptional regulator